MYQNFKDFLMDELKPMESGHPKASMKHRSRIGGGGGLVVVTLDWVVQIECQNGVTISEAAEKG